MSGGHTRKDDRTGPGRSVWIAGVLGAALLLVASTELRHDDPPAWAWVVAGTAVVSSLGAAAVRFVRTFDSPTRKPMEVTRSSAGGFVALASLLGVGAFGVTGIDDEWSIPISAGMLAVGLVALVLLVRHLRKPVEDTDRRT